MSHNRNGFSLVGTLVGMAVASGLMLVLSSMFLFSQKETQRTREKLTLLDTKRDLTLLLGQQGICNSMIANLPNPNLDVAMIGTATPPIIDVGSVIPSSSFPGSAPFLETGEAVNSSTPNLIVTAMRLVDFVDSGNGADFFSYLQVDVTSQTGGALRPIRLLQLFGTVAAGGVRALNSCKSLLDSDDFSEKICTEVFGFEYDPSKSPPCVLGEFTVDQKQAACLVMEGVWNSVTQKCTMSGDVHYNPVTHQCTATFGNNLDRVKRRIVALLLDPEYRQSQSFVQLALKIGQSASHEEALDNISLLVGVPWKERASWVSLIYSTDFGGTEIQRRLSNKTGLPPEKASDLLLVLTASMRGM